MDLREKLEQYRSAGRPYDDCLLRQALGPVQYASLAAACGGNIQAASPSDIVARLNVPVTPVKRTKKKDCREAPPPAAASEEESSSKARQQQQPGGVPSSSVAKKLYGNAAAQTALLKYFDHKLYTKKPVLLVHGPPGAGKSTAVMHYLVRFKFDPVVVNASDCRNIKRLLEGDYGYAYLGASLGGAFMSKMMRPRGGGGSSGSIGSASSVAIVLEEFDGLYDSQENASFNAMFQLAKCSPASQRKPIVCVANDVSSSAIYKMLKHELVYSVPFYRLKQADMLNYARAAMPEAPLLRSVPLEQIGYIVQSCNGDMRQLGNFVSFYLREGAAANGAVVPGGNAVPASITSRAHIADTSIEMFSQVKQMFSARNGGGSGSVAHLEAAYLSDPTMFAALIQENYAALIAEKLHVDVNAIPLMVLKEVAMQVGLYLTAPHTEHDLRLEREVTSVEQCLYDYRPLLDSVELKAFLATHKVDWLPVIDMSTQLSRSLIRYVPVAKILYLRYLVHQTAADIGRCVVTRKCPNHRCCRPGHLEPVDPLVYEQYVAKHRINEMTNTVDDVRTRAIGHLRSKMVPACAIALAFSDEDVLNRKWDAGTMTNLSSGRQQTIHSPVAAQIIKYPFATNEYTGLSARMKLLKTLSSSTRRRNGTMDEFERRVCTSWARRHATEILSISGTVASDSVGAQFLRMIEDYPLCVDEIRAILEEKTNTAAAAAAKKRKRPALSDWVESALAGGSLVTKKDTAAAVWRQSSSCAIFA